MKNFGGALGALDTLKDKLSGSGGAHGENMTAPSTVGAFNPKL
jgi:hypothetical protein